MQKHTYRVASAPKVYPPVIFDHQVEPLEQWPTIHELGYSVDLSCVNVHKDARVDPNTPIDAIIVNDNGNCVAWVRTDDQEEWAYAQHNAIQFIWNGDKGVALEIPLRIFTGNPDTTDPQYIEGLWWKDLRARHPLVSPEITRNTWPGRAEATWLDAVQAQTICFNYKLRRMMLPHYGNLIYECLRAFCRENHEYVVEAYDHIRSLYGSHSTRLGGIPNQPYSDADTFVDAMIESDAPFWKSCKRIWQDPAEHGFGPPKH